MAGLEHFVSTMIWNITLFKNWSMWITLSICSVRTHRPAKIIKIIKIFPISDWALWVWPWFHHFTNCVCQQKNIKKTVAPSGVSLVSTLPTILNGEKIQKLKFQQHREKPFTWYTSNDNQAVFKWLLRVCKNAVVFPLF